MAGNIFINYRRDESGHVAGRLHESLAPKFGRNKLFMDVDNIPVGSDFEDYLKSQVAACDAMLAIIGPNWLDGRDETGQRRLDNPQDFVAIEIGTALARNIPVVPVLVDGARMPKASELPDSLKPLARRQAIQIRHTNFRSDAEALVKRLREALGYDSPQRRWRVLAIKAVAAMAVLFLVAWGGYTFVHPTRIYLEESFRAVQQLVEEARAERERQARVAAEAEEKRKADEVEQQRLAAAKVEQDQAKAAAEVEAKRKAGAEVKRIDEQAERLVAALRADEERRAEAEAKRKAEAEVKRIDEQAERLVAALRADEERRAEAEAKRKAEAERIAQERQAKAAELAKLRYTTLLRCKAAAVGGANEILDFEVAPEKSDGLKGIQIFTQGIEVSIPEVTVGHVGDGELVFHLIGKNLNVASNSTSQRLSLGNDSKPLSRVRLVYRGSRPPGSFVTPSLCIEGLKERL